MLVPHQYLIFYWQDSFFFQDQQRVFFVTPEKGSAQLLARNSHPAAEFQFSHASSYISALSGTDRKGNSRPSKATPYEITEAKHKKDWAWAGEYYNKIFRFELFYHPFTSNFIQELNRTGVEGLFQRSLQAEQHDNVLSDYGPSDEVANKDLLEHVDFERGGAYEQYNWEVFFHAPFLIAERLRQNQRFADAQKWYHYIFDPTRSPERLETEDPSEDIPERFWITKPLQKDLHHERIQELLNLFEKENPDLTFLKRLVRQTGQWLKYPFDPHVIARYRLVAYQKAAVMKYLDNLIAWGDHLFAQDTLETINEATQLYILALGLLGEKPVELPERKVRPRTVEELRNGSGNNNAPSPSDVSDALPAIAWEDLDLNLSDDQEIPSWYLSQFCIPRNEKLMQFWATIEDRLFKIRHCMNNEGMVRQLPLFQPPIEPGLLVRAAAAGLDLSQVATGLQGSAQRQHYRFQVMVQKALELVGELKSLGAQLLAALEKKDAEDLALLRSRHEIDLLSSVKDVRQSEIKEAEETLRGLKKSKDAVEIRYRHYRDIEFMNESERAHLLLTTISTFLQSMGQAAESAAAVSHAFPTNLFGMAGLSSPVEIVSGGGENSGNASQAFGRAMSIYGTITGWMAQMSQTMGSYQRRAEEWALQQDLAAKEIEQHEKQILAAEIRKAIAEVQLKNHLRQIDDAKETDTFMREKYTNRELYSWMVSQISGVYFQTYRLAHELAQES